MGGPAGSPSSHCICYGSARVRRRWLERGLRSIFQCVTTKTFKPVLLNRPEFHAEWLRDEPSDATTTCPRKTGVWCQLLLATARNMRFGGRFSTLCLAARTVFRVNFTFALLSQSLARSFRALVYLRGTLDDCCLRTAMSGMRTILRDPAAVDLR